MKKYCICSHIKSHHDVNGPSGTFCRECYNVGVPYPNSWHNFQLDNLKLVEDLAKTKGLI
jgi:hypothetical protein